MASYKLVITKSAQKDIRKLPKPEINRIDKKIKSLRIIPRPFGCEKLKGSKSSYRIRVGDYRIIYTIYDKKLIISVIKVGHRRDIYKKS